MNTQQYITFTEETNAVDYLEKTVFFIRAAEINPLDWKWVILAVHGALYGFMVCALKGTTPDNVSDKTKEGERKLLTFLDALKKCQKLTDGSGCVKPLILSLAQKRSVRQIDLDFRNHFIHFLPTCWSIELAGMSQIVANALDVIQLLGVETGCIYAHQQPGDRQKISALVDEGKILLQKCASASASAKDVKAVEKRLRYVQSGRAFTRDELNAR